MHRSIFSRVFLDRYTVPNPQYSNNSPSLKSTFEPPRDSCWLTNQYLPFELSKVRRTTTNRFDEKNSLHRVDCSLFVFPLRIVCTAKHMIMYTAVAWNPNGPARCAHEILFYAVDDNANFFDYSRTLTNLTYLISDAHRALQCSETGEIVFTKLHAVYEYHTNGLNTRARAHTHETRHRLLYFSIIISYIRSSYAANPDCLKLLTHVQQRIGTYYLYICARVQDDRVE